MLSSSEILTVEIDDSQVGQRLDQALAFLTGISRTRIQALLTEGMVSYQNQVCTSPSLRVHSGDMVQLTIPEAQELHLVPQDDVPFQVIFEDDHLVVVDKPAGVVVHPGPGHAQGTLVHGLLARCGETLSGIGGMKRPGIVHRLDKGTSGLLVVAKNDEAHLGLSQQFADKSLFRVYQAFVWGMPKPTEGLVNLPLGRHPAHRQKQAVVPRGREAVTHYRVLKIYGGGLVSLIECRLETGRTHQIRVHMQAIRHPVLGDPLYGKAPARLPEALSLYLKDWTQDRQALHAQELSFVHPASGEQMDFQSSIPQDLQSLKQVLETL
jgi:23S rRNA pseudouridine1911/1915/1917 synthase